MVAMKKTKINFILHGAETFDHNWALGNVMQVVGNPAEVNKVIQNELYDPSVDAWLFWDASLGMPDPERIQAILELPGDLWHAGLALGMSGLPRLMDYVAPTWMLNCDPPPGIEATSWRVSLRAAFASR